MESTETGKEEIESYGQREVGELMSQEVLWGSGANNKELWATSSKTNIRRNEDALLLHQVWHVICCAQVKRGGKTELCGGESPEKR